MPEYNEELIEIPDWLSDINNSPEIPEIYICSRCQSEIEANQCLTHNNEILCSSCRAIYFSSCPICSEIWSDNEFHRGLCPDCFENEYFICDDCGEITQQRYRNEYATEFGEVFGLCPNCQHEREKSPYIYNSDYEPSLNFYPNNKEYDPTFPYMGLELEIECQNVTESSNLIHLFDPDEKYIYQKYDGSLNNGLEIVSHPMSLKFHKDFDWKYLLEKLSDDSCRSHDTSTCGLHIHLSKGSLSEMNLICLVYFWHRFNNYVQRITRRRYNNYCMDKTVGNKPSKYLSRNSDSRYEAINVGYMTIEFRQFKGTLKYESFMACLEMVHSLALWVKTISVMTLINSNSYESYFKFVQKNKSLYEYLYIKLLNGGEQNVRFNS